MEGRPRPDLVGEPPLDAGRGCHTRQVKTLGSPQFGVASLIVPQYDIEFRGFTEFGVVNSVNPLNSLSYRRNSHPATLYGETTKTAAGQPRRGMKCHGYGAATP